MITGVVNVLTPGARLSISVASFIEDVNPRLAKRPLETNGRLANRGLTSLVKQATVD